MADSASSSSSSSQQPGAATREISLRSLLAEAVFVGTDDIIVRRCCDRADKCRAGDVFIARCGPNRDEHDHVDVAIRRGASAVVAERLLPINVPQCLVPDTARTYARLCQELAGNPSGRMLTIGVVGTLGKTTTALFVSAALKRLGGGVAYRTSLGTSDSTQCDRSATRCPGPRRLARWLSAADRAGAPAAVIELSERMLAQKVAAGVEFDLIIVTGLRPDQRNGATARRCVGTQLNSLLRHCPTEPLVLFNADDAHATAWSKRCAVPCASYGIDAAEHVRAKRLSAFRGEQQLLVTAGRTLMPLTLKIPGDHVARAALAAVATAWMFELSIADAIAGAETLTRIPGRMQRVQTAVDIPVHIDDASTPDRLAVALHALRQHQFGPTTVVHDLQADVDAKWRGRIGEVLQRNDCRIVLSGAELAPQVVQEIAMDVLGGVDSPGKVQVIPDRQAAIAWAIANTHSGNILLSGRGASTWVSRDGELVSDEAVAQAAIDARNSTPPIPPLNTFPPIGPDSIYSH